MKRIKQGEDFEQLVKEYSQANKAITGGLWPKLAPDSLVEPYDVLAQKAATMKPGETAGPIEVEGHIFVMQLVEYQPKNVESFEKVQNQVKARISFERMRRAIDKLNEELVSRPRRRTGQDLWIFACGKFTTRRINRILELSDGNNRTWHRFG